MKRGIPIRPVYCKISCTISCAISHTISHMIFISQMFILFISAFWHCPLDAVGSQNNDIHVMSKSYAWRPLACLPILKNKLMEITDPTAQARRRLGLYHACLEHIIEQINALIKEPFYLRFADRKVRLCQTFYHVAAWTARKLLPPWCAAPAIALCANVPKMSWTEQICSILFVTQKR